MKEIKKISIGVLAKTANVSVRTLQYYDSIDVLKPSFISEGGRRYYQENDVVLLHQIKALKSLGLTLDEIKTHVIPIQNETDVLNVLEKQKQLLLTQLAKTQKVIDAIQMLKLEITESHDVDWMKYAQMMQQVEENNNYYWVSHYLENDIVKKIVEVEANDDKLRDKLFQCLEKAIELEQAGISPSSETAQKLVSDWWQYMNQYANGNVGMIEKLCEFYRGEEMWPAQFGVIQINSKQFMEQAVAIYMSKEELR